MKKKAKAKEYMLIFHHEGTHKVLQVETVGNVHPSTVLYDRFPGAKLLDCLDIAEVPYYRVHSKVEITKL